MSKLNKENMDLIKKRHDKRMKLPLFKELRAHKIDSIRGSHRSGLASKDGSNRNSRVNSRRESSF